MTDILIPPLRDDLEIQLINDNGEEYNMLSDPFLIATQPVALPPYLFRIISSFDRPDTFGSICDRVESEMKINLDREEIFRLVKELVELGYFSIDPVIREKEEVESYLLSGIRQPVCSGYTYPSEREDLEAYLEIIMKSGSEVSDHDVLFAPHIDFRVGEDAWKCYASGFNSIRKAAPDLVVIIGTAHYRSSAYFMLTEKDFETPLGTAETDKELISKISSKGAAAIVFDDLAHKPEHSLELHLLMAQYIYRDRPFKILPILAGSINDTFAHAGCPSEESSYSQAISVIRECLAAYPGKVVLLASGDLSHTGRKFGDDSDASESLEEVKGEDAGLLSLLEAFDSRGFYQNIAAINDANKVCGLAPFYALMNMTEVRKSRYLGYGVWNEEDTGSAVTFASLSYKK